MTLTSRDLNKEFSRFDINTPQETLQKYFEEVYSDAGFLKVLDKLYEWEMETGYISKDKIENKKKYNYPDDEFDVVFRAQVNFARDGYTPNPKTVEKMKTLHCPICKENIGIPGKENLRVFQFKINKKDFFIQLTPFPLFNRHFVLVLLEKKAMRMDRESVVDLVDFIKMAPAYTACSNSDVEWAGASILKHHHYQVFENLELPVMRARFIDEFKISKNEMSYGLIDYPLATCLVVSKYEDLFVSQMGKVINLWKNDILGKNTCNLVIRKMENEYRGWVLFRNPDFRTPRDLLHIKKEGVGVIEVAGEGIYPVPKGDEAKNIWNEIENNGLNVIKKIIKGNNPVERKNFYQLFNLIKES